MWFLYQLLYGLALLILAPWMLLRRGLGTIRVAGSRLGRSREPGQRRSLWIHAVSVGEVGVAGTLIDALPSTQPIVLTTVTPTGQARARAQWSDRARIAYLPFDFGFALRRFMCKFDPIGLISVEGDRWPLMLRVLKQARLPVMVVNGRISDRTYRRMTRMRPLLAPLLRPIDLFALQSEHDRDRLLSLGVDEARIAVTGNLKFDSPAPTPQPELESEVRHLANGRPILVAGSTMAQEEEIVLAAFERAGGGQAALLVLAPRHPERWDEVAQLLQRTGLRFVRRSQGATAESPDVLLLDSLGELAALYRIARAAFVGGTLVPTGGHNPLEAMRFAVPVVVGPSMENFRDMAEQFDRAEAWRRVHDAAELGGVWKHWLDSEVAAREDGGRGREIVNSNRGALEKTIELLDPILHPIDTGARESSDG